MTTLTRSNRPLRRMANATGVSNHPVMGVLGLIIVALGIVGIVSILPDVMRYLRLRNM